MKTAAATTLLFVLLVTSTGQPDVFDREFDCSEEQRRCFESNSVYSEETHSCHLPGTRSLCPPGHFFAVSREHAQEGDIAGACVIACPEGYWRPADKAKDDPHVCERMSDHVCLQNERPLLNIFNEETCVPMGSMPSLRANFQRFQCRLPSGLVALNPNILSSECNYNQITLNGHCYYSASRGPCKPGEWLVVNRTELFYGRIVPICERRPCPEGEVLLPEDNKCHSVENARSILCFISYDIQLDISGMPYCFSEQYSDMVKPGNYKDCVDRNGDCEKDAHIELPEIDFESFY